MSSMHHTESEFRAIRLTHEMDVGPETFAYKVLSVNQSHKRESRAVIVDDLGLRLDGSRTSDINKSSRSVDNKCSTSSTRENLVRGKIILYQPERSQQQPAKSYISYASLDKLVEKLTDASSYDNDFRDAFLLTYRSFCTPLELVNLLIDRYRGALNELSSNKQAEETPGSTASNGHGNVVIFRVISVLKHWIKESGYIDFDLRSDPKALDLLHSFLGEIFHRSPLPAVRHHAENLRDVLLSMRATNNSQATNQAKTSKSSSSIHTSGKKNRVLYASSENEVFNSSTAGSAQPSRFPASYSVERNDNDRHKNLAVYRSSRSPTRKVPPSAGHGQEKNRSGSKSPVLTTGRSNNTTVPPPPTIARGVTTGSMNASPKARPRSSSVSGTSKAKSDSSLKSSRSKPSPHSRSQPLIGLSSQEVAEQLTLVEATRFYTQINRRELTNRAWTRQSKRTDAPNVVAMIELFDARTEWVSSEILHSKLQTVERAKMLAFFIEVADHCYRLHNFNTLFQITMGLAAPCISQLHATWGLVHNAHTEKFQCLQQICSSDDNYKNYRQAFALCDGQPRLPCLFVFVKDLFSLEESMNTIENGLIHFRKFKCIHDAISEVLDSENQNYWNSSRLPQKKRRICLQHDEKLQGILQHRLETVRKKSVELFRLGKKANTQESILFVKSLSEAGFL